MDDAFPTWDYCNPKRMPYPYFGGKWTIADKVWAALGDVPNYVEHFCGKADVLMARPHAGKVETINDVNGFVTNAHRAIKYAAEAVADVCDWPVAELDLHARHRSLIRQARETDLIERLRQDETFYDADVAGKWIWGGCCWIGSGWCDVSATSGSEQVPFLNRPGQGIHQAALREPSDRMPEIGGWTVHGRGNPRLGKGVHGETFREPSPQIPFIGNGGRSIPSGGVLRPPSDQLPSLGGTNEIGRGVHSGVMRDQLPHLAGGGGTGVGYGRGVHSSIARDAGSHKIPDLYNGSGRGATSTDVRHNLHDYFRALAQRLRYVRIVCGDWKRLRSYSALTAHGLTGCFLDPPYKGYEDVYGAGSGNVSAEVSEWCREVGNDPMMRIVLAGYEGEHDLPGWRCIPWKARGGYSSIAKGGSNGNEHRERLWLSPHCLDPDAAKIAPAQASLFEDVA